MNNIPTGMPNIPMTPEMIRAGLKQEAMDTAKHFTEWMVLSRLDTAELIFQSPANENGAMLVGFQMEAMAELGNIYKGHTAYPIGALKLPSGEQMVIRQFSVIYERSGQKGTARIGDIITGVR